MDIKTTIDKGTATDPPLPGSSIFFDKSKQLKQGFRKKLISMKQDKNTLEEVISQKNSEIQALMQSVKSLNEVINSVPLAEFKNKSSSAAAKIVELNRKNSSLTAELDSCRAKNTKLEMKLHKQEEELRTILESRKDDLRKMSESALEDLTVEFNQTKEKLFKSLNQNVELKNQLKLAQKCIQQEIGENVNLSTLAAAGTSWRGRAQTIMSLQLKINDLKEQLGSARSETCWAEECLVEPPVRREQIYHRAEVDVLQKDIASLTSHIEEQNQKISALKARNKNLTADMAKMKAKCSNADAQASQHDSAIEALNEKLKAQKFFYENKMRELQKQINGTHKDRSAFEFQQEELKVRLENLQRTLASKEEQVVTLNRTIQKLEGDLKSVCGDFLFDCREFGKEEFVGILNSLEGEKNNLLELNKVMNERLETERNRVLSLNEQISKQKIKICQLEARIRELERIQENQNEKKKRNQRITEYANSIHKTNSVSSFVFENTSCTDILSPSIREVHQADVLDLKNKLEIAHEKIFLLEDKLTYLNREKQSDAKAFESIIKSSKTAFLETANQMRTTRSPASSIAFLQ